MDMSGLQWPVFCEELSLRNLESLTSFNGMENLTGIGAGGVLINGNTALSTCLVVDFINLMDIEGSGLWYDNGPCQ